MPTLAATLVNRLQKAADPQEAYEAANALLELCQNSAAGRERIVAAGGVPVLLQCIARPLSEAVLATILAVLSEVLQHSSAAAAQAVKSAALFVQLLKSSSQNVSGSAQAHNCLAPSG
jgi:hypothetical protein